MMFGYGGTATPFTARVGGSLASVWQERLHLIRIGPF
jgi:hypothetical protein